VWIWVATCLYGFCFKRLKNWKKSWIHIKTTQVKTDLSVQSSSSPALFFRQKKDMCHHSHIRCCSMSSYTLKLLLLYYHFLYLSNNFQKFCKISYSAITSLKSGSSKKSFNVILKPSHICNIVSILKFFVSFFRKSDIVGKDIPAALDKSQSFILFCFNSCFILFLVASESCNFYTSFLKIHSLCEL